MFILSIKENFATRLKELESSTTEYCTFLMNDFHTECSSFVDDIKNSQIEEKEKTEKYNAKIKELQSWLG